MSRSITTNRCRGSNTAKILNILLDIFPISSTCPSIPRYDLRGIFELGGQFAAGNIPVDTAG